MNTNKKLLFFLIGLLLTFLVPNYAMAKLVFTFEGPGVQNTTVQPGEYNVETFDNLSTGAKSGSSAQFESVIGSFSGTYTVKNANQYGGAGGNTRYIFASGTNLLLDFTKKNPTGIGYFGFWWSAGSSGNYLDITTVDNKVHRYTTKTILDSPFLRQGRYPNGHFGNPNSPFLNYNSGEPYVFLNFFATDDASKIKFVNMSGTNFESDNYTVAENRQPITGDPAEPDACSAPQSAGTYPNCSCPTGTSLNKDGSACVPTSGTACTPITNPLTNIPAGSDYDGKKITICHFPPGNPNNVQQITISINALQKHLSHHDDAIWEEGKNCPATTTSCATPPTVDLGQKATDYAVPVITGGVFGTSTRLTITVKNAATNVVTSIGTATKTASNGWTVTGTTNLPAGTYDVIATGDTGLVDNTFNELVVSASVIPTVDNKTTTDKVAVPLTGTSGTSISLIITVKNSNNTIVATSSTITPTGGNWTYTPPILPAGTYNVIATGDAAHGSLVDTTSGELVISASVIPTVDNKTTIDTVAVPLTGNVGTSTSLQIQVQNSSNSIVDSGTATIIGTGWSFLPKVLPAGTYNVIAIGDAAHGSLVDITSGELVISASVIPTVDNKTTTEKVAVPLTGLVGSSTALTITVKDSSGISKATGTAIITGTTWTYTPIVLPAGTYEVVATGDVAHGSLVDDSKDELVVNAIAPPTVESQTTFDTTPVIKGTVGTVGLETGEAFTVSVNGITYTNGVDANLVVNGTNWTLAILADKEIPGKVAPYDVVATRDSAPNAKTGSGTLTITPCALPKVVNAAGTECIAPVPTVVSQVIETNLTATPVIHGTVGEVALGSTETFTVKIETTPLQTYNKGNNALVISGTDWTLTVPAASPIAPGTYNVDAIRNTTAKDTTHDELVINLVCLTGQVQVNGSCASSSTLPTVNPLSTDDRTPILTGTVGTTELNGDSFSVTIEGTGRIYTLGSSPELSVTGKTWSLVVPRPPLTPTTYSITATRAETIVDATSDELTISAQCIPPNIEEDGDCVAPIKIPTVNRLVTDISAQTIEVTGTVGNVALDNNETFTVKIHNAQHSNVACSVLITGKTWTCTLTSKPFVAGIFDVDAKRGEVLDETSGELEITDNITICENNVTTSIPKEQWDGTKVGANYYLGACNATPLICKPCGDPPGEPQNLVPQKTVAESPYCDDGGKRSEVSATGVTIKRATIINGTTVNGSLTSLNNAQVAYGEKASAIGNMDIRNATIGVNVAACPIGLCAVPGSTATGSSTTSGATNVELSNVTLENAYLESSGDFNVNTGVFTPNDSWIGVTAGTTNPTDESTPSWLSTIISGIITAGTDTSGSPIRGSINSGRYNVSVTNAERVTKSRRIKGKIVGATITNATTMTSGGMTYVTAGTITAGTFEGEFTAYGTVIGATIVGANLSSSNHCFSSGTVGNKGQLNWKEVVK